MSPRLRRCALCLVLFSLPALASPSRDDRHSARVRAPGLRPGSGEVPPSEARPIASAAASASKVELAGFLGLVAALALPFALARSRRRASGVPAGERH